jgi:hypothetical protein
VTRKPGPPTARVRRAGLYTRAIADQVCEALGQGQTLRTIAKAAGVAESTIRRWAVEDVDGFAARYARARRQQCEHWADEILEIADDGTGDTWVDAEGHEHVNHDHIHRSRLRVDARKWLMSKLAPDLYGERVEHVGAGGEGGPIVVNLTWEGETK